MLLALMKEEPSRRMLFTTTRNDTVVARAPEGGWSESRLEEARPYSARREYGTRYESRSEVRLAATVTDVLALIT